MFDVLLTPDGILHSGMRFVVDQSMDVISFGKPLENAVFVLPDALDQVAGDADIEHPIVGIRHDVRHWVFHVVPPMVLPSGPHEKVRGRVQHYHIELTSSCDLTASVN